MHSSEHKPLVVVYKVDYFVNGSLSSSLVLLNTRVVLLSYSKGLKIITLVMVEVGLQE